MDMKTQLLRCHLVMSFAAISSISSSSAQVPQIINYQGRVVVGGTNFDGTGQFQFALVNPGGTTNYWSNDGTAIGQPTAPVSVTVTKGLYSVLLGDTTVSNMTAILPSVFANSNVLLRVWFNDGVNGIQQLSPDQRLAAVGYAMMAASVPDGSIGPTQLASNALTAANIAPGSIGGAQLAPDAALSNLNASGQSGVASGGIVFSTNDNPALVSAGYVKLGITSVGDVWRLDAKTPLTNRYSHTAVWTGDKMIIWGGGLDKSGGTTVTWSDGAIYDPAANTWTPLPAAPVVRRMNHTAVWTGTEMIIWGGQTNNSTALLNDGARYSPASNAWTVLAASPLGARVIHTAVWTGTDMIVWGGHNSGALNDGAAYDPVADAWTSISTSGAPSSRGGHTAVWTGNDMIVWGGGNNVADGARYNLSSNAWTALPAVPAGFAGRVGHTAVWTGSAMVIWGGQTASTALNTGASYNPTSNAWTLVSTGGAPVARTQHTAVWTGDKMIIWGGAGGLNDGGQYDVASDTWRPTSLVAVPAGRQGHSAVWTGKDMTIFGGMGAGTAFNDTYTYPPTTFAYLYVKP